MEAAFLGLRTPLLQYLRAMGCEASQADEIVQEVFLRFHQGRRSGLEVNDVRGWAFRVARNLWIDSRRESRRYEPVGAEDGGHRADSVPDPERRLLQLERARRLAAEVARLPELQRECLRLKAQGYRYREIAATLKISMTAAAECVRQAVKILKKRSRR